MSNLSIVLAYGLFWRGIRCIGREVRGLRGGPAGSFGVFSCISSGIFIRRICAVGLVLCLSSMLTTSTETSSQQPDT